MRGKRWAGLAVAGAVAAVLICWVVALVAYPLTNPEARSPGPVLSSRSGPLLRGACYDCHSNETEHPWYSQIPVVSLLLGMDVHEGRRALNFSTWDQLTPEGKAKALRAMDDELREGDMPPWTYRLMHPAARLSAQQVQALRDDLRAASRP